MGEGYKYNLSKKSTFEYYISTTISYLSKAADKLNKNVLNKDFPKTDYGKFEPYFGKSDISKHVESMRTISKAISGIEKTINEHVDALVKANDIADSVAASLFIDKKMKALYGEKYNKHVNAGMNPNYTGLKDWHQASNKERAFERYLTAGWAGVLGTFEKQADGLASHFIPVLEFLGDDYHAAALARFIKTTHSSDWEKEHMKWVGGYLNKYDDEKDKKDKIVSGTDVASEVEKNAAGWKNGGSITGDIGGLALYTYFFGDNSKYLYNHLKVTGTESEKMYNSKKINIYNTVDRNKVAVGAIALGAFNSGIDYISSDINKAIPPQDLNFITGYNMRGGVAATATLTKTLLNAQVESYITGEEPNIKEEDVAATMISTFIISGGLGVYSDHRQKMESAKYESLQEKEIKNGLDDYLEESSDDLNRYKLFNYRKIAKGIMNSNMSDDSKLKLLEYYSVKDKLKQAEDLKSIEKLLKDGSKYVKKPLENKIKEKYKKE